MASSTFDPNCLEQMSGFLPRKPTAVDAIGGIFCHICYSTYSNKKEFDSHYAHHNLGSGNIVYTCVACRKEIPGYPSFRNHCYQIHVVKDRFKCEHCSRMFSKLSVLNSHIEVVHHLKFKCTSCQEEFPSKKELQIHQIIHKNEKDRPPYQCQDCNKTIESQDMCELHIDEHCSISYPCPICNEIISDKMEAAKHLTKHFDGHQASETIKITTPQIIEDSSVDVLGGILCYYCDELYKNRSEFDNHFSTDHEDKNLVYSCNICSKQYDKYSLFANHCYFHIAKDRFQCTECGKTFPRLSLLVVHTEAFHSAGSSDKPFRCGSCSHGFKSAARLRQHLRLVHHLSCVTCPERGCDMSFESPKDLILHQRHHKLSSENCCRQCGLQFTTLAACERHLDVHRKKHYSCPICRREYKEKYLLIKHIPQHFESVLHVCKICSKVFKARHRLAEHSKTHSDLRNHICSYCGKGFMKAFQLDQHLNIHTGQKPHKCTVCPKTFASYPNLRKHLRRMHNIEKTVKKTVVEKPASIPNKVTQNVDNKSKIESGIDSTSSEISVETYSMAESDDSTMDSLDPITMDKDWYAMNENMVDSGLEFTDMLPVSDVTFTSATLQEPIVTDTQASAVPPEYGPDFGNRGVDPDDHYLPHIDPLLTIRNELPASLMYVNSIENYNFEETVPTDVGHANWEPYITKVYAYEDNDLSRISIMNTDIF